MDNSLPNTTQNSQQQQSPAQPVGSVAKEFGPIGASVESKPEEYIQPSGTETQPEVSAELQEHGVEAVTNQERPQLTEQDKKAGIEHAKESVPAPTQVTTLSHVQFPMTEEEAEQKFKTTKMDDSDHWLAALVKRVYEKMRFVHGKITN